MEDKSQITTIPESEDNEVSKEESIKEYEIKSDNMHTYKIILKIKFSNLIITGYLLNSKTKPKYSKNFTLKDIQEMRYFTIFDSLEECFEEIVEALDMDENIITERKNKIILKIPLKCKKYNHIIFEMDKVDNNLEENFDSFCQKIIEENNELKNEIKNLKNEIKEIKEKEMLIGKTKAFSCIKYINHPCYLVLVDYKNKNEIYKKCTGFSCNECKKGYDKQIPCFYCPKCDYDICLECFGKNNN